MNNEINDKSAQTESFRQVDNASAVTAQRFLDEVQTNVQASFKLDNSVPIAGLPGLTLCDSPDIAATNGSESRFGLALPADIRPIPGEASKLAETSTPHQEQSFDRIAGMQMLPADMDKIAPIGLRPQTLLK